MVKLTKYFREYKENLSTPKENALISSVLWVTKTKHKPLSNQIVKKKSHDTPPKDRPP